MKQIFLLLMIISFAAVSCKKNDGCTYSDSGLSASSTERAYLQQYLSAGSIAATEHTSGVYYSVTNPGTGISPAICSTITVKYTGTIIPSGIQFDASTNASGVNFSLGQLIVGWQKVLPVLKSGGSIILYIPPSLGYGDQNRRDANNNIIIPGNSYLKFTIELLNVQ